MQFRPGEVYGRYRILSEQVAEGLCGPVYQAEVQKDDGSAAIVALKVLTNKRSIVEQYFLNEERLLKRAEHPFLIRYVHSSMRDKPYLLSTEFIDAIDPKEIAKQKAPQWALSIAEQIGSALDYLHTQHPDAPVIHRDIKPANILISKASQQAILIDLSVALHPHVIFEDDRAMGTPPYMPPEQYIFEETPASDLYALAVSTCEFLNGTGLPKFSYPKLKGDSDAEIAEWKTQARKLVQKQADTIRKRLARYPQTAEVLCKATSFDTDQRYTSCGEFVAVLRSALLADGANIGTPLEMPSTRNQTWISVGAIAAVVAIALIILFFVTGSPASGSETDTSSPVRSALAPTSTLPPAPDSGSGSIAPVATVTLAPAPLSGLAPTSTLPPNLAPTSTLPPAATAAPQTQRVTITSTREIFRKSPSDEALNLLGRKYLPYGEQLIVLTGPQRVKGEQWYQVQRVSDGTVGWVRSTSFK